MIGVARNIWFDEAHDIQVALEKDQSILNEANTNWNKIMQKAKNKNQKESFRFIKENQKLFSEAVNELCFLIYNKSFTYKKHFTLPKFDHFEFNANDIEIQLNAKSKDKYYDNIAEIAEFLDFQNNLCKFLNKFTIYGKYFNFTCEDYPAIFIEQKENVNYAEISKKFKQMQQMAYGSYGSISSINHNNLNFMQQQAMQNHLDFVNQVNNQQFMDFTVQSSISSIPGAGGMF